MLRALCYFGCLACGSVMEGFPLSKDCGGRNPLAWWGQLRLVLYQLRGRISSLQPGAFNGAGNRKPFVKIFMVIPMSADSPKAFVCEGVPHGGSRLKTYLGEVGR
jgi:hypothetical protein